MDSTFFKRLKIVTMRLAVLLQLKTHSKAL